MEPLVEVNVTRLGLDGSTNTYVVILREKGGERILPIWIGQPEAESILLEINQVRKERPLTHDLCKSLIVGLGATLQRVNITRVENRTYFAELHLVRDGQRYQVDARPSDSIAIALRTVSPIYATESLLIDPPDEDDGDDEEETVIPPAELSRSTEEMSAEQLKQYLASLRPEDFGKFNP
ncbi:MAG: bifunctional nuclease family protein [Cytophagaceae bacterium]|nr:bifunctional nuclease family protein [Gemmatimonadaceae bacterium]